jgi:S1-C subfamily serine protease
VAVGDQVWLVGAPAYEAFLVTTGIIAKIGEYNFPDETFGGTLQPYLLVNIVAHSGSSGGGLFNAEGYLVGIATRIRVSKEGYVIYTYVVAPPAIQAFLNTP